MGRIATSPDGIAWTTRANPVDPKVGASDSYGYTAVVFGDGIFVALTSFPNEATKFVISEDNGVTWQALPISNLVSQGENGQTSFVSGLPGVAGLFGGIVWIPEKSCWYGWGTASLTGMGFANICLSTTACIQTSTDLVNWSPLPTPFDIIHSGSNPPFVTCVASDGAGNFRATGAAGYESGAGADFGYVCDACYSTDGVTWNSYGNHTPGFNGPWSDWTVYSVIWDGTNWVYIMEGSLGPIWIINSEQLWPYNSLPISIGVRAASNGAGTVVIPLTARVIAGTPGQVALAVGNSSGVSGDWSSPTNPWTYPAPSSITSIVESVAYGNGLFVAVAASSNYLESSWLPNSPCSVATSPDGFVWTNQGFITAMNRVSSRYTNTGGDITSAAPKDIAFGNGIFVVVGSGTIAPTAFMRQHPRDDRRGLGAARNPMSAVGSASVQSSNRQGYRGTYT